MPVTKPIERPLDKTKMAMSDRLAVADAAHAAMHPMQNLTPEVAVLGVSVLFATLCRRCGLDPHDMHTMANRVLTDQLGHKRANDSLQSLRDFAGIRLMGQETTVS